MIVRGWGKRKQGMIASGYRVFLGKYFGIRMVMAAQPCEYTGNYWEVHFFFGCITQNLGFPNQGSGPCPLSGKCRVLTTAPVEKAEFYGV